ncbi:uncharacterized protein ISCGN_030103 [Ixodes scapularis]
MKFGVYIQNQQRISSLRKEGGNSYEIAQWQDHGGRCGECGDNFGDPRPRRHETGNMFARNLTVRHYSPGDVVDLVVDIETNHLGYFEFALCPRKSWNELETESCFEPHLLEVVGATGAIYKKKVSPDPSTRYRLPTAANGLYLLRVKLPEDLTCDYCVLRWHWKSGKGAIFRTRSPCTQCPFYCFTNWPPGRASV